ncbi:MAG TPA: ABC transporter permease [Clostridia bacterium]|nr:ABC transporter permease [Clostridia bacterium]
MKKLEQFLTQIFVVGFGLVMACIVILFVSKEPFTAIKYFFLGPFSSRYFLGNMLSYTIPLIVTGLAGCVSFSASVWNLGLEGQMYFGMLCGTYCAYCLSSMPAVFAVPIALLVAFLAGGGVAAISAFLDHKMHVDVMVSSLLLANAIYYIVNFVLEGPFNDPASGAGVASPRINKSFMLPQFFPPSDLHLGLFIALALVAVVYIMMEYRILGYEIRITGKNPLFAGYGGINTSRVAAQAMFLSGGLAGLAGTIDILGTQGRMLAYMSGFGWDGISIALIARNNPITTVFVAFFFAFLQKGAENASLFSDISPDIAQIIQAAILFLVTGEALFDFLKKRKRLREETR